MRQSNEENSRATRNQKRKTDRLVNWLIAAVILGIVITGWIVLSPSDEANQEEMLNHEEESDTPGNSESDEETVFERAEDEVSEDQQAENQPSEDEPLNDSGEEALIIYEESPDSFVTESMVDPTWEPIGTSQSGEHVSLYDGESVDWKEKEQALLYATGLTEEDVIIWKIKNGGGPQQSVGIVSSKDQSEKYRVYLEWIDEEGWQPIKVDVLNTLEFDF